MRLHLINGNIPATYPARWYRVETWGVGDYVADFTDRAEAKAFAISDAKERHFVHDHNVCSMELSK